MGLTIVLATGMALSTVPGPVIGLLSRYFIDEFGLTRTEIGAIATGHSFLIMATSVPCGYLADRISGRLMQVLMLSFVFLGFLTMAMSWGFWSLLVFGAIAGIPAAGNNSATNNIIAENVRAGSRGWITGIKQSGVQMGIFAAGFVLPVTAQRVGWRSALVLASLVALVGIALTLAVVPSGSRQRAPQRRTGSADRLPSSIWWLAAYGTTMGVGVGIYHAFLPLYSQEEVGMGVELAGIVLGVSGATGMIARILWGRIAERVGHPATPLMVIGALAVASMASIWAASPSTPVLVWAGAIILGVSAGSWMSVAMLAAITMAGSRRPGRGTASIMFGFGLGLTIGPVLFGWGVDSSGGYDLPWVGTVLNFVVSVALMQAWRRRNKRPSHSSPAP